MRLIGGGRIEEEITEEVENKTYLRRRKGGEQGVTVDTRKTERGREREREKFSRREEWEKQTIKGNDTVCLPPGQGACRA